MPAVDFGVRIVLVRFVLVMAELVLPSFSAWDPFSEVLSRNVVGEHEGRNPRGIGPKREGHQIEHQTNVLLVIAGGAFRSSDVLNLAVWFPIARIRRREKLEAAFDVADRLEILIELV